MRKGKIEIKGTEYEVEQTEHILDHALGMRGRKEGKMFFEFPIEKRWTLDMAFVLSDLYLYFFDSEKKMVEAIEAARGGLNPLKWRIYKPEQPVKYLLESTEPLGLAKGESFELK